jgi:hypothetical protein
VTIAICFNCGEFKHGALTLCKKCNTVPKSEESVALSIVITDHYFDESTLNHISISMKKGSKVELSSELLRVWIEQIQNSGIVNPVD